MGMILKGFGAVSHNIIYLEVRIGRVVKKAVLLARRPAGFDPRQGRPLYICMYTPCTVRMVNSVDRVLFKYPDLLIYLLFIYQAKPIPSVAC
jgi:hypothetical protein